MQDAVEVPELAEARRTIEQLLTENRTLQRELEQLREVQQFKDSFGLAMSAGILTSPVSHTRLLEMIVEAAAQVISARAASLFLIDEETQELIFEVALGQKASEVKHFRLPLGRGIAGLVALSGQPMAVSNAQEDMRQASDIAQAVGYMPGSILCMPLFYDDQVIGVLELLDKEGAASFSATDMEILTLFANQAAVAIEQSLAQRSVNAMLMQIVSSVSGLPEEQRAGLVQEARNFAAQFENDENYRQMIEMAQLVQKITRNGVNELKACKAVLTAFADYLNSKPAY